MNSRTYKTQFVMRQKFTLLLFYILGTIYCVAQEYEKLLFAMPENGKYYYVNIGGERITESIYDYFLRFPFDRIELKSNIVNKKGRHIVNKNGKYGVIDSQGREIVPCEYSCIYFMYKCPNNAPFGYSQEYECPNYLMCKKGNKSGIIDAVNGCEIIPFIYDRIDLHITHDNIILCEIDGKMGGVNICTGKQVISFDYDFIDSECYGLLKCAKNSMYGYIDTNGNVVIPFKHSHYLNCNDGYFVLKNVDDSLWYCYNKKGKKVKIGNYGFGDICESVEKRIKVCKRGKWGFINSENGILEIPYIYDYATDFDNGIAVVKKTEGNNSFFGAIDKNGEIIIPLKYEYLSEFNKGNYAKFKMNDKYGLIDRNDNVVIPNMYDGICNAYGPGNEFLIAVKKGEKWGYINHSNQTVLPFIYDEAKSFVSGVGRIENKNGYYFIDYQGNILGECDTPVGELKKYQYFYSLGPSDVDKDIPLGNIENRNTYVVIIANEEYTEQGVSQVQFAQNDGKIFKDYCMRTLGVPLKNIKCVENATINQMRSSINWVCDMANALDNEANVILYYSGHGIPDEKTGNAYLLPSDGIANDYRSAYSLDELYSQFGNLHTKKTMLFLDACFSGTTKEGKMMLVDSRGVAIKSKSAQPKGNMIVLSAAQGDETAFPYKKKKHGMFTYFLLKKLQETKGDVSLGELSSYINKNVSRNSVMEMGKKQTPSINASVSFLNSDWKNLKLK